MPIDLELDGLNLELNIRLQYTRAASLFVEGSCYCSLSMNSVSVILS